MSSVHKSVLEVIDKYETLTGAGAVSVAATAVVTFVVTTGADALTLADGTLNQLKFIIMKTDGGDGTLTPANPSGFTTVKFTAVGQWALLQFNGRAWELKDHYGVTVATS